MSQIEARICALLARDYETLKLFDTTDIHKFTYRLIFNKSEETEVNDSERYLGKTLRYAIQYDAGGRKLMSTINSDAKRYGINIQISQAEANRFLSLAHEKMPKIRSVFHKEVREALERDNKTLFSPYGRRRQFSDRSGPELFRQAYAQIPQSVPPDHIRRAWIFNIAPRLREIGETDSLRLWAEHHDELSVKCRVGFVETAYRLFKSALEVPIDFSRCSLPRGSITIPVEIKIGKNYRDMEEVRF